jgi:hypothetical protein
MTPDPERTPVAGTDGTFAVERLALPDGQVRYRLYAPLIGWPVLETPGFLSAARCHAAARQFWDALPAGLRPAFRQAPTAPGLWVRAATPDDKLRVKAAVEEFHRAADTREAPDRDWDALRAEVRAAAAAAGATP